MIADISLYTLLPKQREARNKSRVQNILAISCLPFSVLKSLGNFSIKMDSNLIMWRSNICSPLIKLITLALLNTLFLQIASDYNKPLADIHKFGFIFFFPSALPGNAINSVLFAHRKILPYYQGQEKIKIKRIIFLHYVDI